MVVRRLVSVCVVLTGVLPASAAPSDVVVGDRTDDGRPDIVRMSIEHGPSAAARVTVRIRNVRTSVYNDLRLYVDPTGAHRKPLYAFVLGLNGDGGWTMRRTDGWHLGRNAGTCGERIQLHQPSTRVRVVVFEMPRACFGDVGAKFAVRTSAFTKQSKTVGKPDWTPASQALSRPFTL